MARSRCFLSLAPRSRATAVAAAGGFPDLGLSRPKAERATTNDKNRKIFIYMRSSSSQLSVERVGQAVT